MRTETNSSLDTVTEQENPHFFTDHIFSTQHHEICCAVKHLFVLPVFSIQGPVHSNKIM